MEKEYTNCWHGLTSNCPHIDKECMQNLLPGINRTDKYFNGDDIDEANKLCQTCDKFSQRQEG